LVFGLDNPVHIVLLVAVLLFVFGAKRLPEVGKSLGDGMRGFKETISPVTSLKDSLSLTPDRAAPAPAPQPVAQAASAAVPAPSPVAVAPAEQPATRVI
jgi:sec-independent protein translocase protein TatA